MPVVDIEAIKKAALTEVNDEYTAKVKKLYKDQLRSVERAREVLRGEELKLKDLEQQIADGTV